jgi:hypothetical protein
MLNRLLAAAALAACLAIPATAPVRADDGLLWSLSVGGWDGGAYRSDNGQFTHCSLAATYNSDITLLFVIDVEYQLKVGLAKDGWRMQEDSIYQVGIDIDGRSHGRHDAKALSHDVLLISLGNDATLYDHLRRGRELTVAAARENMYFELEGTARALPELLDCVNRANSWTSAGSNPFGEPSETPTANPFDDTTPSGNQIRQRVETLLLASGLENVVFTDPADEGMDRALYTWRSGALTGALYIIPDPQVSPADLVAEMRSAVAKLCTGAFAAQAGPPVRFRVYELRQITAACRTEGEPDGHDTATVISDGKMILTIHHTADGTTATDFSTFNGAMLTAFQSFLP